MSLNETKTEINSEEIEKKLAQLKEKLRSFDADAVQFAEDLSSVPQLRSVFKELKSKIDGFDFEEALEILNKAKI